MAVLAGQGTPDWGRDPQGGIPWCCGSHPGHCSPWGFALHVAGRAQTTGAVWTSRLRKNYDPVQRSQGLAWYGGERPVDIFLNNDIIILKGGKEGILITKFLPPSCKVVGLNFSSATTPELLLKTFDHYCEYRRTPNGVVLAPVQLGKWLVLFCDEINLPDMDKYGTQRVISFLRQVW